MVVSYLDNDGTLKITLHAGHAKKRNRHDCTSRVDISRILARRCTDTAFPIVEVVPYKIHMILTDNGIQFADLPKHRKPTRLTRAVAGGRTSPGFDRLA